MGSCGCGGLSYQDTKKLAEECVAAAIANLPADLHIKSIKERVAGGWCAVLSNGDTLDIPLSAGTGITVSGGTVSADVAEIATQITGNAGALQELADAINTDVQNSFVDNGDGTSTFTAPDGTTLVVSTQDIDTFAVDSTAASAGTDSYGRAYPAGTPVVLFPQSGRTLAFPTIETVFEQECFNLPQLDANCGQFTPVGWVNVAGCGKLVRASQPPFPLGYQQITSAIQGTFTHSATKTNTRVGFTGDVNTLNPGSINWFENFYGIPSNANYTGPKQDAPDDPIAKVTFTKEDFCGLATPGQKVQLRLDSIIGYYTTQIEHTDAIGAFQWGTQMYVNGQQVAINGDGYGLSTNGYSGGQSDLIVGEWTTDGNDMCVEVYFHILSLDSEVEVGDEVHLDMAQIGVTITPVN